MAAGRASMLGRAVQFIGVSLRAPLVGIAALGIRALDVFRGILTAVVNLGRSIVTWIAETGVRALQAFTRAALIAGLAAAAAFTISTREAASFEMMMRYVNTITRTTDASLAQLSADALAIARDIGKAPAEVARGLYDVASAGFKGAEGLKIVRVAAEASVAGMTDVATASRLIVSTLQAYGMAAEKAGYISDVMFKTVELGIITFGDLAQAIGPAIATAAAAGVQIEEVGAAFATMTKAGIDASMTGTSLQRIMLSFLDPAKEFADALRTVGVEQASTFIRTKGLAGAIDALNRLAAGNPAALANMGLEMRALRAAMSLTRGEASSFSSDLAAISQAAGATGSALAQVAATVGYAWDRFKARAQAMFVTVGSSFAGLVRKVLEGAGDIADRMSALAEEISQSDRWQRLVDTVGLAMDAAGEKVGTWLDWLSENWDTVWDAVADRVGTAANFVVMWIGRIVGAIGYLIEQRQGIWDWARTFMDAMVAVGQAIVQEVLGRLDTLAKSLGTTIKLPLGMELDVAALKTQIAGAVAGGLAGAPLGPWGAAGGAATGFLATGKAYEAGRAGLAALGESVEEWGTTASAFFDEQRARFEQGQGFFGGMKGAAIERGAAYSEWLYGLREAVSGLELGRGREAQGDIRELGEGVWAFGDVADSIEEATAALNRGGQQLAEKADGLTAASRGVATGGEALVGAAGSLSGAAGNLGAAAGTLADAAKSIPGYLRGAEMAQRYGLMASIAEARGKPEARAGFLREQEAWQERQVSAAVEAFRNNPADIRLLQIWERAETDLAAIRKALEEQDRMAVDMPDWWPRADVLGPPVGVAIQAAEVPAQTNFQVARPPVEWGDFPLAYEQAPGDNPDWQIDRLPTPGDNPNWRIQDVPAPGDNPDWQRGADVLGAAVAQGQTALLQQLARMDDSKVQGWNEEQPSPGLRGQEVFASEFRLPDDWMPPGAATHPDELLSGMDRIESAVLRAARAQIPVTFDDLPLIPERAPREIPDWRPDEITAPAAIPDWRMDRTPILGDNPDWRLEDIPAPGDRPDWIASRRPTEANEPGIVINVGEVNSKEQLKRTADEAIDVWWDRHVEHEETYQNY